MLEFIFKPIYLMMTSLEVFDTLIGLFLLLAIAFIFAFIGVGIFMLFDKYLGKEYTKQEGKISSKCFTEEYTSYILINNIMTPIVHNDCWTVEVITNGFESSIDVQEKFYNEISINDSVLVDYRKGYMSRNIYLTSIFEK